MCPYLTKFTATAWSINKIIPVSIGLVSLTFCLHARFKPEARNPPKGPIRLENRLTRKPCITNG